MINKNDIAILNFDDDRKAKLTNQQLEGYENLGIKYGVICFETGPIEDIVLAFPSRIIGVVKKAGLPRLNIYAVKFNGTEIILHPGVVGAPLAACFMENLVSFGCKNIIAMGCAGVLNQKIARGHLIIPNSAIRQEGTSYHYVAPGKYIEYSPKIINKMTDFLTKKRIPFVCGRTWTTDALFRETKDLIAMRKKEGCVCVEMENSALGAVAQFYGLKFGQILYGADCLEGSCWALRKWESDEIKQKSTFEILKLAMELVTKI